MSFRVRLGKEGWTPEEKCLFGAIVKRAFYRSFWGFVTRPFPFFFIVVYKVLIIVYMQGSHHGNYELTRWHPPLLLAI